MKVAKDCVVGIEYSLHLGDGKIIDASDGDPILFIQGAGQIVPGLEKALEGAEVGTEKQVKVSPDEGYGDVDTQAIRLVPREAFPKDAPIEAGAEFVILDDQQNEVPIRISKVENGKVTVDFNHPLAGKTLHFSVKVTQVRTALPEELEHGHAHGDDDHHGHEHAHGHDQN